MKVDGVAGTHDLHLWSVAGDDRSLTVHISLADNGDAHQVRQAVAAMLKDKFAIDHATIQTELEPTCDTESVHGPVDDPVEVTPLV